MILVDTSVSVVCLMFSYWLYCRAKPLNAQTFATGETAKGYILVNKVSHARFLPNPSSHAFSYPTLSLLLDVKAVTGGELDLGRIHRPTHTSSSYPILYSLLHHGWIFGVGSRAWSRLTNLRPAAYLLDDGVQGTTLIERLKEFGLMRGLTEEELGLKEGGEVWLMTSPSYLGFEGINPLSVWYCYGGDKKLKIVLLEVHNTFGERHVYVLRAGVDSLAPIEGEGTNFNPQWTMPRQFHVSPFNDRSGYYVCTLSGCNSPFGSSSVSKSIQSPLLSARPMPYIRLDLLTDAKLLKLTAISRTTVSIPLSSCNLLRTLFHYPFILLLTIIRISYHAAILHYSKRLDVFARPEPLNPISETEIEREEVENAQGRNGDSSNRAASGQGVGWQPLGILERLSQQRIDSFLRRRAKEVRYNIHLIPANPVEHKYCYPGSSVADLDTQESQLPTLVVQYLTHRFFLYLFILPSALHALLLGSAAENIFTTSDDSLFLKVFQEREIVNGDDRNKSSLSQMLRIRFLSPVAPSLSAPHTHSLDLPKPGGYDWQAIFVIVSYYAMENVERMLYLLFRARFVEGDEPWKGWERLKRKKSGLKKADFDIGSVRRI